MKGSDVRGPTTVECVITPPAMTKEVLLNLCDSCPSPCADPPCSLPPSFSFGASRALSHRQLDHARTLLAHGAHYHTTSCRSPRILTAPRRPSRALTASRATQLNSKLGEGGRTLCAKAHCAPVHPVHRAARANPRRRAGDSSSSWAVYSRCSGCRWYEVSPRKPCRRRVGDKPRAIAAVTHTHDSSTQVLTR